MNSRWPSSENGAGAFCLGEKMPPVNFAGAPKNQAFYCVTGAGSLGNSFRVVLGAFSHVMGALKLGISFWDTGRHFHEEQGRFPSNIPHKSPVFFCLHCFGAI